MPGLVVESAETPPAHECGAPGETLSYCWKVSGTATFVVRLVVVVTGIVRCVGWNGVDSSATGVCRLRPENHIPTSFAML